MRQNCAVNIVVNINNLIVVFSVCTYRKGGKFIELII